MRHLLSGGGGRRDGDRSWIHRECVGVHRFRLGSISHRTVRLDGSRRAGCDSARDLAGGDWTADPELDSTPARRGVGDWTDRGIAGAVHVDRFGPGPVRPRRRHRSALRLRRRRLPATARRLCPETLAVAVELASGAGRRPGSCRAGKRGPAGASGRLAERRDADGKRRAAGCGAVPRCP